MSDPQAVTDPPGRSDDAQPALGSRRPSRRAVVGWVAVALSLLAFIIFWDTSPSNEHVPGAKTLDEFGTMTMPDVVGMAAGDAEEKIEYQADGVHGPDDVEDLQIVDFSPLKDRSPYDDWQVVATSPKAGDPVTGTTKVRLFSLQPQEIAWYQQNRRMPTVTAGEKTDEVVAEMFADVEELILYRYPKGTGDSAYISAETWLNSERGVDIDPRVEPKSERNLRKGLKEASSYKTLVIGTRPDEKDALRLGQLLVLVVKDAPEQPAPDTGSGSSGGVSGSYSDDDDDFNVPGWLCPTRFC